MKAQPIVLLLALAAAAAVLARMPASDPTSSGLHPQGRKLSSTLTGRNLLQNGTLQAAVEPQQAASPLSPIPPAKGIPNSNSGNAPSVPSKPVPPVTTPTPSATTPAPASNDGTAQPATLTTVTTCTAATEGQPCSGGVCCDLRCVGFGQAGLGRACCGNSQLCGTNLKCSPPNGCQCDPSKNVAKCGNQCVGYGQVGLGGQCCGYSQLCGTNLKCSSTTPGTPGTCQCDPAKNVAECGGKCVGFGQLPVGSPCCGNSQLCGNAAPVCNAIHGCACDNVNSFYCGGKCVGKGQVSLHGDCCGYTQLCGTGLVCSSSTPGTAGTCQCDTSKSAECNGQCVGFGQLPIGSPCCGNDQLCGNAAPVCNQYHGCACDNVNTFYCDGKCVGYGQVGFGGDCCGYSQLCGTNLKCSSSTPGTAGTCQCDPAQNVYECNGKCVGKGQVPVGQACCSDPECGNAAPYCRGGICHVCEQEYTSPGQGLYGAPCCENYECGTGAPVCDRSSGTPGKCVCAANVYRCNDQCVGRGQGVFGAPCCPDLYGSGTSNPICGTGSPYCNPYHNMCLCDEDTSFACNNQCVGRGQGVIGAQCCGKNGICGSGHCSGPSPSGVCV